MTNPVRVRFWGTRGSLARPGPRMARYGGNTSCVQVTSPSGSQVIIDCGTGAFDLGRALLADSKGPLRGSILISHTHWDHIQGFPFFSPLFVPGGHWDIYGPAGLGTSLRETLAGQMEHTYFPVTLDQMGARIDFHDLAEGSFQIDDIKVSTRYLNHPALTLGYRLEVGGTRVVYTCDHEPHSFPRPQHEPLHEFDRRHVEFLADADLLIHDAQFTNEEYAMSKGWGHSPVEYVVEMGHLAGVKAIALTHHDPSRTDDEVDRIVAAARKTLIERHSPIQVFAAAEGQVVELAPSGAPMPEGHGEKSYFDSALAPAVKDASVIIGVSDAGTALLLTEAARSATVRTSHATDADSTLRIAKAEPPSLILLEDRAPGFDGLEVCRSLRSSPDRRLRDVPIVVVAERERAGDGKAAGVTRWLITPFSVQYARAQVQSWVFRSFCRWRPADLPADEEKRLNALHGLSILDTQAEERFDRITRLAATVGNVPIVLVSLVDRDRQWFKSCQGLAVSETSREQSFCAHAVLKRAPVVVPDTLQDDRFADNPLVIEKPRIRFYAGFPIFHRDGNCLGTLCLIDTRPRQFRDETLQHFEDLARLVEQEINSARPATSG